MSVVRHCARYLFDTHHSGDLNNGLWLVLMIKLLGLFLLDMPRIL